MRAGRSILGESIRALRYRRALVKLRGTALLAVGIGLDVGAGVVLLVGPFDALMFCACFVAALWGAFFAALGTWELL